MGGLNQFFSDAVQFLPILMSGLMVTISVTLAALAISVVLGLVWALMGISKVPALRAISRVVINTVRGIPIDVVADRLGTSRNTVYKTLHDARRRLREDLVARGHLEPTHLEEVQR